jgi:hypothetical protein
MNTVMLLPFMKARCIHLGRGRVLCSSCHIIVTGARQQ